MIQKKYDSKNLLDVELNSVESYLPGYPSYSPTEDIYSNFLKEEDINPEDVLKTTKGSKKKSLNDLSAGRNLDVPGAELDDDMEDIGSEDEENNYYSLGGDAHNDLDENHG